MTGFCLLSADPSALQAVLPQTGYEWSPYRNALLMGNTHFRKHRKTCAKYPER